MSAKQGEFVGPYEVSGDETIQGRISGPVTVRTGAHLVVQGMIDGPVEVESDAALTVQGLFSAQVVANDGLILIAGMTTTKPWRDAPGGRYALARGTLIQSGRSNLMLRHDGLLEELTAGPAGEVDIDQRAASVSDYLYFDAAEDRFVRLDE
ncbi:polymer-forming cytoskeletal protein [Pimelobacter sp. 30-1]|uniref:polymer-forming cytoskeletal protein n=1 Tax=Pimelobacter sp. 30-1 TaxID=2004991 RepID=UPI001C04E609|nr:polymer-forming cytoskeletal protein [Pimelobacter sp. 30-1]MBU2698809.1 hypothetical protein [Pimelobacter sp. 30-1]